MEADGKRRAIGLKRGTVELLVHGRMPRLFEDEKARLQSALGQHVLDIQHIGRTTIPGMIAKPIIDIGIAVMDFEDAKVCIPPIEHLG